MPASSYQTITVGREFLPNGFCCENIHLRCANFFPVPATRIQRLDRATSIKLFCFKIDEGISSKARGIKQSIE
jgi:hypothetical protein